MFCGNGGSAADSQHLAAEFTSLLRQEYPRPGLAAVALTTDTSFLTANANDFGFEGVFARLTQALGRKGDTLVGISTSGNSRNVVRAFEQARAMGIGTVAFTGIGGGRMAELADVVLSVPSNKVQHIQETHIALGHLLCQLVEESLFPNPPPQ
jgi:D-sedoheptulose 7-phosphate isomerase